MTTTPQAPEPSPILFFQTATAYQRTYALKAALEVGLFSVLGEGPTLPRRWPSGVKLLSEE